MRELDVLLSGYLESHYEASSEQDKAAFRQLLTLSDPELVGYLLAGERPDDDAIARLVARIRGDNTD
jgi:antitoxin CptB